MTFGYWISVSDIEDIPISLDPFWTSGAPLSKLDLPSTCDCISGLSPLSSVSRLSFSISEP